MLIYTCIGSAVDWGTTILITVNLGNTTINTVNLGTTTLNTVNLGSHYYKHCWFR